MYKLKLSLQLKLNKEAIEIEREQGTEKMREASEFMASLLEDQFGMHCSLDYDTFECLYSQEMENGLAQDPTFQHLQAVFHEQSQRL